MNDRGNDSAPFPLEPYLISDNKYNLLVPKIRFSDTRGKRKTMSTKEFWKIHGKEVMEEMNKFKEKIKKKKKKLPKIIKQKKWKYH